MSQVEETGPGPTPGLAPVRVAIVNDYEVVVAGVAAMLAAHPDLVEVVELDSRRPVLTDVDVVLYDTFGQLQGSALDLSSLTRGVTAKIVIFSWNVSDRMIDDSMRAGAAAYVSKGVTAAELAQFLQRVHAGESVTPATVTQGTGDTFGTWPGAEVGLSPREAEVLALICQGLSNQEITERIFLGLNTVKTYIRTLYQKIGADSRSQAVLWGVDHGFRPDRSRIIFDPES